VAPDVTHLVELVRGCTFDDFLLTPQHGIVPRRDPAIIDLATRFTTGISLKRPIVSANMDTITRAAMATALAEEGGIGVIDRGFRGGDIGPQIAEVTSTGSSRTRTRSTPARESPTRCARWNGQASARSSSRRPTAGLRDC
jgi:hypothetical protein